MKENQEKPNQKKQSESVFERLYNDSKKKQGSKNSGNNQNKPSKNAVSPSQESVSKNTKTSTKNEHFNNKSGSHTTNQPVSTVTTGSFREEIVFKRTQEEQHIKISSNTSVVDEKKENQKPRSALPGIQFIQETISSQSTNKVESKSSRKSGRSLRRLSLGPSDLYSLEFFPSDFYSSNAENESTRKSDRSLRRLSLGPSDLDSLEFSPSDVYSLNVESESSRKNGRSLRRLSLNSSDFDLLKDQTESDSPVNIQPWINNSSEKMDLSIMPQHTLKLKDGQCLTTGDAHGNVMLIIHLLVRAGIITNMTQEKYKQLFDIYTKKIDELSKEDIRSFREVLHSLEFDTNKFVRFLGDDLSDRGKLDLFTLYLYEAMHNKGLKYEIALSNHSIELLVNLERHFKNPEDKKFKSWVVGPSTLQSMLNMNPLMKKGIIEHDEVDQLTKKHYRPFVKLVCFNWTEEGFSFFNHAAIGLANMINLGKCLGLDPKEYDWDPKNESGWQPEQLAFFLHQMNMKLQDIFEQNDLQRYFECQSFKREELPTFQVLWNRSYTQFRFPEKLGNESLTYYHGHDHGSRTQQHIISLDSDFGKHHSLFKETDQVRQIFIIQDNPNFCKNDDEHLDKNQCHDSQSIVKKLNFVVDFDIGEVILFSSNKQNNMNQRDKEQRFDFPKF